MVYLGCHRSNCTVEGQKFTVSNEIKLNCVSKNGNNACMKYGYLSVRPSSLCPQFLHLSFIGYVMVMSFPYLKLDLVGKYL